MVTDRDKIVAGDLHQMVLALKHYLIKAVFNSSSQQTVTIIEVLKEF